MGHFSLFHLMLYLLLSMCLLAVGLTTVVPAVLQENVRMFMIEVVMGPQLVHILPAHTHSFNINQHTSTPTVLNCGMSQGSVLGSLLLALCTTPLASLLTNSDLDFHLYVDDMQLFLLFASSV